MHGGITSRWFGNDPRRAAPRYIDQRLIGKGAGSFLLVSPLASTAVAATMPLHEEGTPTVIYHVVQKALWDKAQADGVHYFPPRYDIEGFIHATHEANLLLGVLNWQHPVHGFIYKDIPGTFLCLAIDTEVLTSPVKMEAAKPTESNANPIAFPHIFGPIAPLNCVTRQMEVVRDADGTFLSIEGL